MAEYIGREAACSLMPDDYYGWRDKQLLKSAPAADVAPVRHGRWIPVDEMEDAFDCSECDAMVSKRLNYCPKCGAHMMDKVEGGDERRNLKTKN